MADSPSSRCMQVAILLFHGVDLLDFAGPLEVLSHAGSNPNPEKSKPLFDISLVAKDEWVHAASNLTVKRNLSLDEARDRLSEFEVLVVPGGPPKVVMALIENGSPELQLIRNFAELSAPSPDRILFSVCTGALLLGGAGLLEGKSATTHHMALDALRAVCQTAAGRADAAPTHVVHARLLDGGLLASGARIITAGGITSGLDAALHVLALKASRAAAESVARRMEYDWHQEEGVTA
jgi:transcriptional regulator GlxA family with amidase domain